MALNHSTPWTAVMHACPLYMPHLTAASGVSTWLDSLRVRMLTPDEILRHDPQQPAFSNVNTPEDFAEAERIAREVGGL